MQVPYLRQVGLDIGDNPLRTPWLIAYLEKVVAWKKYHVAQVGVSCDRDGFWLFFFSCGRTLLTLTGN